jgi:hypothetical protein
MSDSAPVVYVVGGGTLFKDDMPFPLDTLDNELDRKLECVPLKKLISCGITPAEKKALRWAQANKVEAHRFERPWLHKILGQYAPSVREAAMALKPDIVISLAGKWPEWQAVHDAAKRMGMEQAHGWALASTYARPEWITEYNTVILPLLNKEQRERHLPM